MAVPRWWKVRREFLRAYFKLVDALPWVVVDRVRQAWYDLRAPHLVRETMGRHPLGERVAVFVLYQPGGLAASSFLTLDHLVAGAWSVIAVSNAPLSDQDRDAVAARSACVIERPNVGYDFGAYREGWRWLGVRRNSLQRLILLNDSTWFPLRRDDTSLTRMEALELDLAGHVFKTVSAETGRFDHVEAHLLMFGPRALSHPAVADFWSGYVMANARGRTIRRGETGLTQAVLAAGLTAGGLLDVDRVSALLAALPDAALFEVLGHLALRDATCRTFRADLQKAAQAGKPWREAFLAWTRSELSNSRRNLISATFVDPAMAFGGMGFLKKARDRRSHLARLAVMRAVDEGRIAPPDPGVRAEIDAAIRNWVPPDDWRNSPDAPQAETL